MNTEEFVNDEEKQVENRKEAKKPLHGKFTQNLENRRGKLNTDSHKGSEDTYDENSTAESNKEDSDQKVIFDLKKAVELLNDKYIREVADKENMKRIMTKNSNDAVEYAVKKFANDIIGCCDNLERVLSTLVEDDDLHKGIKMTWSGFIKTLEDHGVERIDPLDEPFDPNFHHSICQVFDDKKKDATVIEVKQVGYTIKGRLLRPAMVIISKENDQ